MNINRIAIILLNYNSYDDCKKCIGFLKLQENVKLEIVVVDNYSQDKEMVAQLCEECHCTFIANNKNSGYNAGNNVGLRYAAEQGYEFAMIANPDMEFPQRDYMVKMLSTIQKDDNIVVCGSDILTPEGIHQNPREFYPVPWYTSFNWINNIFAKKNSRDSNKQPDWVKTPTISRQCVSLHGCCIMLRMIFLEKINYFDERIFLYGEESVLSRQVAINGKKMFYYAEASAVHNHKRSNKDNQAFNLKHWRHSRILYIQHYSNYPWYGKIFATVSNVLYIFALSIHHKLKK